MTAGRAMRGAAAVVMLAAGALVGGCADKTGSNDISGRWTGPLTITFSGRSELSGGMRLRLDQQGEFASGTAVWSPIGETQSIAGPVEGIEVSLLLDFRCAKTFETAVLSGTVSGDSIDIDNATGKACSLGGEPFAVTDADASLTRTSDGLPL